MPHFKNRIIFCILSLSLVLWPLSLPAGAQPDLPQPEPQQELKKYVQRSPSLSPDGRFVAVIEWNIFLSERDMQYDPAGSQIILWEVAGGKLLWRKRSPANQNLSGSFSPDGRKFVYHGAYWRLKGNVVAERKNYVYLWDTASGESLASLELEETEDLRELVFSPDGQKLVGGLFDFSKQAAPDTDARHIGKVWDANTGKLLATIRDKPALTLAGRWETQGERVITSSNFPKPGQNVNHTISIWSWPDLDLLQSIDIGEKPAGFKALSPDGKQVAFTVPASPTPDGHIRLWDDASKKIVPLPGPDEGYLFHIHYLGFLVDGKTLVGSGVVMNEAGHEKLICQWDTASGKLKYVTKPGDSFGERENLAYRIRLLPDSKSYVTVNQDGIVELRSLEDGSLIRTFEERD